MRVGKNIKFWGIIYAPVQCTVVRESYSYSYSQLTITEFMCMKQSYQRQSGCLGFSS